MGLQILQSVIRTPLETTRGAYLKPSLARSIQQQYWINSVIFSGKGSLGREWPELTGYLAHSQ